MRARALSKTALPTSRSPSAGRSSTLDNMRLERAGLSPTITSMSMTASPGAEFSNRPGFLRLMNSLKPRTPFQVLVMSEESRLGREAIETAYALKQLVQGGVRVFFYLEDRERTLDSPTDKIMLSLTTFADELEREKARQRTYDAMIRKARAGHVTGGCVFGYDNVDVLGPDGNGIVIEALLDEVLDMRMLEDSVDEALRLLQGENPEDRIVMVDRELATVEQERSRLVAAIAAGGQLDGLLQALQVRETRHAELEARRDGMRSERRLRASDADRVRDELMTLATSWRQVLSDDPTHARPIVSSLLRGRVTFTPTAKTAWWEARGQGSFEGLFTRVFASGMASPTGYRHSLPGRFRGNLGVRSRGVEAEARYDLCHALAQKIR